MQPIEFENIVLKYIFQDESARDKILPFLDGKIFDDFHNKEIVKNILQFEKKYSKFPTVPDLKLLLENEAVFKTKGVFNRPTPERALIGIGAYRKIRRGSASKQNQIVLIIKGKRVWGVSSATAQESAVKQLTSRGVEF